MNTMRQTMKEIELSPIRESSKEYEGVESALKNLFRTEIYLPLLRALGMKTLQNSKEDDLLEAVRRGRISFSGGKFTGSFSATTSRALREMGAKWRKNGWEIPKASLPDHLQDAIEASETQFKESLGKIDKILTQKLPEDIANQLKLEKMFDSTLWKADKDFRLTVKGLAIIPDLKPETKRRLSEEYANDMKRYVKGWAEKEIVKLRKEIQSKHFINGNRQESLVKMIQNRYDVAESKAKFLARQETKLLVAKFKEIRYNDVGIQEYTWRTVAGTSLHPVRPSHKKLDGKTFRFDDPPVTTSQGEPLRRNNPGQDFNCRCYARPIMRFA